MEWGRNRDVFSSPVLVFYELCRELKQRLPGVQILAEAVDRTEENLDCKWAIASSVPLLVEC
ncbi:unnamed protein product [Symbiodinium natans]|uniref:Uncharacterized protein n=1 Tax=Symbiodinium natans TaxID=878477 RepID=A0A812SV01_9DINO|nr:unnamed protein product [Symbiodinium natans]